MAYVRTVRTSSGAVAVQVVWKSSRGSRDIEHLGSAHSEAEVELLKAVAAQRIAAGQDQLPLDVAATGADGVGDRLVADGSAAGCDRCGVSPARVRPGLRQAMWCSSSW